MSDPFIGEIKVFPYTFAPRNWAICNGGVISIAQNTTLFSIIGTTYGGDGRTTMGLPNLEGRTPMHSGRGPGLTNRRLGEFGGEMNVTLNQQEMPGHKHTVTGIRRPGTSEIPASNLLPATDRDLNVHQYNKNSTNNSPMANTALSNAGDSQPHVNYQPFLAFRFCIALEGLYPSRS